MRRFLIESKDIKEDKSIEICRDDANHIKNVLRMRIGDKIFLTDGKSNNYDSEIIEFSEKKVNLKIIKSFKIAITKNKCRITVAQSYLKDKKMDTLVRQLSELGMDRWVAYISERSIPRIDKQKKIKKIKRWEKIAKESFKQCMRSELAEIYEIISFDELINSSKEFDLKLIFWENETIVLKNSIEKVSVRPENILIVLGPEGGFSNEEAEYAIKNGFISTSLGPRILKAETAATAALSIIQYIYGDMGTLSFGSLNSDEQKMHNDG